mmetsp:Transcript_38/g.37  ORF Transcript_38/g.37 Transcript_38/m.37 type:complete len:84 (-) Transcript_38:85-336(-)
MKYPVTTLSSYQRGPEPLLSVMGVYSSVLSPEENTSHTADLGVDDDLTQVFEEVECILDDLMKILSDDTGSIENPASFSTLSQ